MTSSPSLNSGHHENFYQFLFYSSKLIPISVEIAALALSYHLCNGVRHLLTDFFHDTDDIIIICFVIIIYTITVLLAPLPWDKIILVIQVLGGSSGIFYATMATTPFQRKLSFTSFLSSSLFGFLLTDPLYPIAALITLLLLPRDWVFLLLLIGRCFAFEGGIALLIQIFFLFLWKEGLRIHPAFSLYLAILYLCVVSLLASLGIFLAPQDFIIIIKYPLFPLSGACAIFFLYIAKKGKDHLYSFSLYFSNGLFLFSLPYNKAAAYDFFFCNLFLILVLLSIFFFFKRAGGSQAAANLNHLILEAKDKVHVIYFSLIGCLILAHSHTEWVTLALASLFLQVGLIDIHFLIFRGVTQKSF